MSFEQHKKDIEDIKTMKNDRTKMIQNFIEKMKSKAGLDNGKEKGGKAFARPLHDSSESERRLEKAV